MWRREHFTPSIHCHPSYNPAVRCVDSLCGTVQYMCTYRTGDRNASNSAKEDRRASKSSCTQRGRKRLTVNSTSDIFTTSRKWVVSFPFCQHSPWMKVPVSPSRKWSKYIYSSTWKSERMCCGVNSTFMMCSSESSPLFWSSTTTLRVI